MKKNNRIVGITIGVCIVIVGVILYLYENKKAAAPTGGTGVITTGIVNTYRDDTYGFTFHYPSGAVATGNFARFYILSDQWMAEPSEGSTGKLLVSVIGTRLENAASYPRYYDTEVRVGVSTNPQDVANCTKYSQDVAPTAELINGISFVTYPIQDAAAMQYMAGKSYRVVHNNMCFVIEHLKTGSNYRDDKSPSDLPDSLLEKYYNDLNSVIESFQFTY